MINNVILGTLSAFRVGPCLNPSASSIPEMKGAYGCFCCSLCFGSRARDRYAKKSKKKPFVCQGVWLGGSGLVSRLADSDLFPVYLLKYSSATVDNWIDILFSAGMHTIR
jgi:hypothetical protein